MPKEVLFMIGGLAVAIFFGQLFANVISKKLTPETPETPEGV